MSAAFQGNAFQLNAWQVPAGVLSGDFECTVNIDQDSDGCSVDLGLARVGVPGGPVWVAIVNGRRVVGSYWDIRRAVEKMAEETAEEAKEKPLAKPRRVRIVVQPGRPVAPKTIETPIPKEVAIQVQKQVRDFYQTAYKSTLLRLDEEEDDIFLLQ